MAEQTEIVRLTVDAPWERPRLDAFLATRLPWRSRRSVVALVDEGAVDVNGARAKKSRRLAPGDVVEIRVPAVDRAAAVADLDIPILFEDDALIVVDKPAGLAMHPASTCPHRHLLGWLQARAEDPAADRADEPSIVHRLDRTTSGVVAVARRREHVAFLTAQFERRTTAKQYLAIVHGDPPAEGRIELPLVVVDGAPVRVGDDGEGGKPSRTDYRVVARGDGIARLEIDLHTGRKHQIRVHLAAIGHPIVGDHVYGPSPAVEGGPRLHAARLSLDHPDGRRLTWRAPAPAAWERFFDGL